MRCLISILFTISFGLNISFARDSRLFKGSEEMVTCDVCEKLKFPESEIKENNLQDKLYQIFSEATKTDYKRETEITGADNSQGGQGMSLRFLTLVEI
ncbi:hypothetical protein HHI36_007589 [Cryptolaemus montrouzieri]|uniref:Uncharacterized protein n=1 Tax=Cryptolaemus montrouzieri TaxID=559131 RepID=A0ABD2MQ63_9CUCU